MYYKYKKVASNFTIQDFSKIESKIVYVLDELHEWATFFVCPCGCGDVVELNLLPDASPAWKVNNVDGIAVISPSIQKKTGCKSHFIISNSGVTIFKS